MPSPVNLTYHDKGRTIRFDWQGVKTLAANVVEEIMDKSERSICSPPERVFALGKGAMPFAAMIADEGIPVFYAGVRSYSGKEKGELEFYQPTMPHLDELLNRRSTLIVDDLWDSGQTFGYAAQRWPEAKRAALLSKKASHGLTYVGLVLPTDAWIVFPWE